MWDEDVCIPVRQVRPVCPHAVIRAKVYEPKYLADAPSTFKSTAARWKEFSDYKYTLQVSPEDCTGCTLCVRSLSAKNKSQVGLKAITWRRSADSRAENANWAFFESLPEMDRTKINPLSSRTHSCCSRCSNSRVRAPAAVRRRISS